MLSGDTDVIGTDFFARLAEREGLVLTRNGAPRGLVPDLSVLESSGCSIQVGITSEVLELRSPEGELVRTAWVREIAVTGNTLYAGSYSVCSVPGHPSPCIRVVFPLPNGNAHVILKPQSHRDGSLTVSSRGKRFGDPGFYFFVQSAPAQGWARYVATLKEDIHVFAGAGDDPRANHTLELWGKRFLRLHYRMRAARADA
jgi:hypothetical protein